MATKWGIIGLTQAVAMEAAADGIRVNCVAIYGYTMTDMLRKSRERLAEQKGIPFEQAVADVAALSPQNRIVSAEEVADVIVWLASDLALSVHGQTINANAALYRIERHTFERQHTGPSTSSTRKTFSCSLC